MVEEKDRVGLIDILAVMVPEPLTLSVVVPLTLGEPLTD